MLSFQCADDKAGAFDRHDPLDRPRGRIPCEVEQSSEPLGGPSGRDAVSQVLGAAQERLDQPFEKWEVLTRHLAGIDLVLDEGQRARWS